MWSKYMTVDGLIEFYQQWLEESLKHKAQGFEDGIDVEITMLETFLNHLHILNGDDRFNREEYNK